MSANLTPISVTDTFGVWKDRTNEIITELETAVNLGDTTSTNANGNVVINGYVKASNGVSVDTISPISGGGTITAKSDFATEGNLSVNNNSPDEVVQISMQNDGTTTWRIRTSADHNILEIETPDNSHTLRLDSTNNIITAVGLTIDPAIISNLDASSVNANTFTQARIPTLPASKITTGTFAQARIPNISFDKITANTSTGDFSISSGSLTLDNNNDSSTILTLSDTSSSSNTKVMALIEGQSANLEIMNWPSASSYALVNGDTAIVLGDSSGFDIYHRNINDNNGFDPNLKSGSYNSAPFSIHSSDDNQVKITSRAPTYFENVAEFSANTLMSSNLTVEGNLTVTGAVSGINSVPTGAVQGFLRTTSPTGWLQLNGDSIPNGTGTVQGVTANFSELYTILVSVYGSNSGNPIALPDMRGYFPRAYDGGTLTEEIGERQQDELKAHTHTVQVPIAGVGTSLGTDGNGSIITGQSSETGGNETRPKNIAFLYCIKY